MPFDGRLCFLAGHAALGYVALSVDARKRLMGGLFVFFAFGGETGLINENEGDIQGYIRRAAVAELVDAQR